MKATFNKSAKEALVLMADDIKKLFTTISDFADGAVIAIGCRDEIARYPKNMDDLLNYENSSQREIHTLRLAGISNDSSKSARLTVKNTLVGDSFDLEATGPEEDVARLTDKIQEILAGLRPKYGFLAKTNLFYLGIAFAVFIAITVVLLASIIPKTPASASTSPESWQSNAIVTGISLLVALGPIILGLVLELLKSKVFPLVTFGIGQGKRRHTFREYIRTVIIVGIIVSMVAGLITYRMTN